MKIRLNASDLIKYLIDQSDTPSAKRIYEALINHYSQSVSSLTNYDELTKEEKSVISYLAMSDMIPFIEYLD